MKYKKLGDICGDTITKKNKNKLSTLVSYLVVRHHNTTSYYSGRVSEFAQQEPVQNGRYIVGPSSSGSITTLLHDIDELYLGFILYFIVYIEQRPRLKYIVACWRVLYIMALTTRVTITPFWSRQFTCWAHHSPEYIIV